MYFFFIKNAACSVKLINKESSLFRHLYLSLRLKTAGIGPQSLAASYVLSLSKPSHGS
jgi:hypothetical protein